MHTLATAASADGVGVGVNCTRIVEALLLPCTGV